MSVQAMAWVFDHSPTQHTDRLVLLAIANHAGKSPASGAWEAWPGIERIRREAGLSRARTVTDALARLIDDKAIQRVINGAPDQRIEPHRRPNLYRILLTHGVPCDDTPQKDPENYCRWCYRGDAPRRDGVTPDDEKVAPRVTQTISEPSGNPTPPPGDVDHHQSELLQETQGEPDGSPGGRAAKGGRSTDRLVVQAVALEARRQLDEEKRRGKTIETEEGWLTRKRQRLQAAHGEEWEALAAREHPANASELLEQVERARAETSAVERAQERAAAAERLGRALVDTFTAGEHELVAEALAHKFTADPEAVAAGVEAWRARRAELDERDPEYSGGISAAAP